MKDKKAAIILILVGFLVLCYGCINQKNNYAEFTEEISENIINETLYDEKNKTDEIFSNELSKNESLIENKLKIPENIKNNCIGFLIGSPEESQNIYLIGAGWERPHHGPFVWDYIEENKGEYDFSYTDEYVLNAQKNNVSILATIWPFANWDQNYNINCKVNENDIFNPRGKDRYDGLPKYRCKPNDMDAYKEFLRRLVERYDGDGINDMPELKIPIKNYEILNEPEMQSEELTFFVGNEIDYFEVLKESYITIKESCTDCQVLHAGCAGSQEKFLSFWEKIFEMGGNNYFDIANIHYINSGDLQTLNVKPFAELLDRYNIKKPIWVTEVEFSDTTDNVLQMSRGAFDAGAEKIFYVSFNVGGHEACKIGEYSPAYINITNICKK